LSATPMRQLAIVCAAAALYFTTADVDSFAVEHLLTRRCRHADGQLHISPPFTDADAAIIERRRQGRHHALPAIYSSSAFRRRAIRHSSG